MVFPADGIGMPAEPEDIGWWLHMEETFHTAGDLAQGITGIWLPGLPDAPEPVQLPDVLNSATPPAVAQRLSSLLNEGGPYQPVFVVFGQGYPIAWMIGFAADAGDRMWVLPDYPLPTDVEVLRAQVRTALPGEGSSSSSERS